MEFRGLDTTEPEDLLRDRLIAFFGERLELKLRPDEATYILIHRFDSFCVAYNKFSGSDTEQTRETLVKIADVAIRNCARNVSRQSR